MNDSMNLRDSTKSHELFIGSNITENVYENEINAMKEMTSSNDVRMGTKIKKATPNGEGEIKRKHTKKKIDIMSLLKKDKKIYKMEKGSISDIYDSYLLSNPEHVDQQKYYLSFSELNKQNSSDKNANTNAKHSDKRNSKSAKNMKKKISMNKKKSKDDNDNVKIKKKKSSNKKKKKSLNYIDNSNNAEEEAKAQNNMDKNLNFEPHEDLKREVEKIKADIDKIKKKGNVKRIYDDLKYILLFQNEIIDILIEDIRKNKLKTKYEYLEDSTIKDDINKVILNQITFDLLKFKYINTKLKELILCVYDTKKFNSLIKEIVYNKINEMKRIGDQDGELTFAKTMLSFLYKQLKYSLEEEVQSYYDNVKNLNDDIHNIKKNVINLIFNSIDNMTTIPSPEKVYNVLGNEPIEKKKEYEYKAAQKKQLVCPPYYRDLNDFFYLYDSIYTDDKINAAKASVLSQHMNKFKNYCIIDKINKGVEEDTPNDNTTSHRNVSNKNTEINTVSKVLNTAQLCKSSHKMETQSYPAHLSHQNICMNLPNNLANNVIDMPMHGNAILNNKANNHAEASSMQFSTLSNAKPLNEYNFDGIQNGYINMNTQNMNKTYSNNRLTHNLNIGRRSMHNNIPINSNKNNNVMMPLSFRNSPECNLFCNGDTRISSEQINCINFVDNCNNIQNEIYNNNILYKCLDNNYNNKVAIRRVENLYYDPNTMQLIANNNFVPAQISVDNDHNRNLNSSHHVLNIENVGNEIHIHDTSNDKNAHVGNNIQLINYETKNADTIVETNMDDAHAYTGFEILSNKDDFKKIETFLNDKWGSFKLFEKWLKDCSKWQWIDLKLQREYINNNIELEKLKDEKKKYLEKCINNKIKELWCGRVKGLMNVKLCNMEKKIANEFSVNNIVKNNIHEVTLDYERSAMCHQDLYAQLYVTGLSSKKIEMIKKVNEFNNGEANAQENGNDAKKKKDSSKKKGYVHSLIYSFNKKTHKQDKKKSSISKDTKQTTETPKKQSLTEKTEGEGITANNNNEDGKKIESKQKRNSAENTTTTNNNINEQYKKRNSDETDKRNTTRMDKHNNPNLGKRNSYNEEIIEDKKIKEANKSDDEYYAKNSYENNMSYLDNDSFKNKNLNKSEIVEKSNNNIKKKKGDNVGGSFFGSFFMFKSDYNKKGSHIESNNGSAIVEGKSDDSNEGSDYSFKYNNKEDKKIHMKKKNSKKSNISTFKKIFNLSRKKKKKEDDKSPSSKSKEKNKKKDNTIESNAENNEDKYNNESSNQNSDEEDDHKKNDANKKKTNKSEDDEDLNNKSSSIDEFKFDEEFEFQILKKEVGDHLHIEDDIEKSIIFERFDEEDEFDVSTNKSHSSSSDSNDSNKSIHQTDQIETQIKTKKGSSDKSEIKTSAGVKNVPVAKTDNLQEKEKITEKVNQKDEPKSKKKNSVTRQENNEIIGEDTNLSKVIAETKKVKSDDSSKNKQDKNKEAVSLEKGDEKKECNALNVVDKTEHDEVKDIIESTIKENETEKGSMNKSKRNDSIAYSCASYYSNGDETYYDKYSKIETSEKKNKNKFNKFLTNLGKFGFKHSKKKGEEKTNYSQSVVTDNDDTVPLNKIDDHKNNPDTLEKEDYILDDPHLNWETEKHALHSDGSEKSDKHHNKNKENNKSEESTKKKMSIKVDKLYSYIHKLKEKKRSATNIDVPDQSLNVSKHKEEENSKVGNKIIKKKDDKDNVNNINETNENNKNTNKHKMENPCDNITIVKKEIDESKINEIEANHNIKNVDNENSSMDENLLGEKYKTSSFDNCKKSPRFGNSSNDVEDIKCDEKLLEKNLIDSYLEQNSKDSKSSRGSKKKKEKTKKSKQNKERNNCVKSQSIKDDSSFSMLDYEINSDKKGKKSNNKKKNYNEIILSDDMIEKKEVPNTMYNEIYLHNSHAYLDENTNKRQGDQDGLDSFLLKKKNNDDSASSNSLNVVKLSSFISTPDSQDEDSSQNFENILKNETNMDI
ncbi:conserved Plasmodium protein, unknown function [Plasmodium chabaudi chabaudi]|uniref:Uncharacterized protein n=1 Tax=Plasmodium chabaudi chabaudi TaxID=31271 RepID=A0A4V0KD89_PLACU|nr:conserved Plasmodium protein, unknown function [Plasmodium chabaudi chabaudi]VTZ70808.1 conserved Plasmodium protein, unknown function [Plasmodium chabaudi chabaudi]|eukprot:XP_016654849.1 conserved Plasmodium protein, unknown function [Plasmodium chabaudi chabaudi]